MNKKLLIILFLLFYTLSAYNQKIIDKNKNDLIIADLKNCLKQKIKYPFFMRLNRVEGRVIVNLLLNNSGNLSNIIVVADYFGKIYELEKFENSKKIERYREKVEKKVLPVFTKCLQNISFVKPDESGEKVIKIPVSFGTFDDFDDYGNDDGYDDYDYMEDYDYHYYDYE